MHPENRCPQCGVELTANAPAGLCPGCLLQGGLKTEAFPSNAGGAGATADFAPPTPEELATRFPELELLACIGRGGMGMVYKARQKHLDRIVALKILAPQVARDPAFAERFSREARAMAMLNHPHIVTVYDFGQTPAPSVSADGTSEAQQTLYYFVMEYVDGVTLRQLLDAGQLAPHEALAIVPQICDALQFAHDKGVVHRDIKPENILLDRNGQVKIADFGLAKLVGQPTKEFSLTGTGQVMGTPHYMAPEQMQRPQEVDHRADIYSLGVVFYQMLTGELPLGRFMPPSKKVQIDVRLDEVVLRALENEPALRFQQASEVKTCVETIVATPVAVAPLRQGIVAMADARISRTAVVGAVWAPLFLFVLLAFIYVRVQVASDAEPQGPQWWQLLMMFTLLPLGLASPFGATILGLISLSQIRHSAGRIYGLGLALFDSLVYPLLVLDGLIGWMWFTAARMFIDFHANPAMHTVPNIQPAFSTRLANLLTRHWPEVPLVLTLLTVLAVDFFLVRAAWRSVNGTSQDKAGKSPSAERSRSRSVWKLLAVAGVAIGLVTLMAWGPWFSRNSTEHVTSQKVSSDQVKVEDMALEMLVAIREKDDAALKAAAVEQPKAWRNALPHFAMELRERFVQFHGTPFSMYPTASLVEGDRAVVKCETAQKEAFLVLYFRKTDGGWRNWMMRNAPPNAELEKFLEEKPPEATASNEATVSSEIQPHEAESSSSGVRDETQKTPEPASSKASQQASHTSNDEATETVDTTIQLEFRIVPNGPESDSKPNYPRSSENKPLSWVEMAARKLSGKQAQEFSPQAVAELSEKGPRQPPTGGEGFTWVEVGGESTPPDAIVGQYDGKKYVLLCDTEPYVLLPKTDAEHSWGLEKVEAIRDSAGQLAIRIRFDQRGGERFAALTKANLGNSLAMIVDGHVLSAPKIRSVISRECEITGKFTEEEVAELIKAIQGSAEAPYPKVDKAPVTPADATPKK